MALRRMVYCLILASVAGQLLPPECEPLLGLPQQELLEESYPRQPETPEAPGMPETPGMPSIPGMPETPGAYPKQPDQPGMPETYFEQPETSGIDETPYGPAGPPSGSYPETANSLQSIETYPSPPQKPNSPTGPLKSICIDIRYFNDMDPDLKAMLFALQSSHPELPPINLTVEQEDFPEKSEMESGIAIPAMEEELSRIEKSSSDAKIMRDAGRYSRAVKRRRPTIEIFPVKQRGGRPEPVVRVLK